MSLFLLMLACAPEDPKADDTAGSVDSGDTGADTGTDTGADTGTDTGAPIDADGDGADATVDCDDTDASRYPGAPETCDGVDEDCDDAVDEDATDATDWYADGDGDGWGGGEPTRACAAPKGHVAAGGDCDDGDGAFHPGAAESCEDPTDYNCDGLTGYSDGDGDGFAACEECDDADAADFPGAPETCDGEDDDCDGTPDEDATDATTWYRDEDGDGHGVASDTAAACARPAGYAATATDCDDGAASVNPDRTEDLTDGVDNDCDGWSDGVDTDGDGLDDASEVLAGTDPTLTDSDGDAWDDGVEVDSGTDPRDAADHPYTGGWPIGACRDSLVATGTAPGDVAPDFGLVDQHGDTLRLHDLCEQVVLLDFAEFW